MPRPRILPLLLIITCIMALGGGAWAWRQHSRPSPLSPELATPRLSLATLEQHGKLQGKRLFFTPAALEFLKPRWPQLGMSETTPEAAALEFEATLQNPKTWRALDRKWRFDALLLMGDPAQFRQLLDHLRASPDWTLTWLDPTSLVFERGTAPQIPAWTPRELPSLQALFQTHTPAEQEIARIQTAHRLIAIGDCEAAQTILEEAIKSNPQSAPTWTELAICHAALRQWDKALETAVQAVALNKNYLPALAAKANALYACGKFNDALTLTRILTTQSPEDGQLLTLHAKVTHAAHAYQEEIATLTRILALSQTKRMPLATWRIYLAQAYAADSQGEASLKELKAALNEPDLTEEERVFVKKGIDRIESRQPLF